MTDAITRELKEFIWRYIDAVELLEVLLLVRKCRGRDCTVRQVTDELRSSESSISNRLTKLERSGFLTRNEMGYRFAPRNEELEAQVEALARIYLDFRLRVIEEIYRSRDKAIQVFADAFKFRREDDDG